MADFFDHEDDDNVSVVELSDEDSLSTCTFALGIGFVRRLFPSFFVLSSLFSSLLRC